MVGQFGDDMLQNHTHVIGYGDGSGDFGGQSIWSRFNYYIQTEKVVTLYRAGIVTQGKRKGVKYIIKAL